MVIDSWSGGQARRRSADSEVLPNCGQFTSRWRAPSSTLNVSETLPLSNLLIPSWLLRGSVHALAEGDDDGLFLKSGSVEIQHVGEHHAHVADVGDGEGEEMVGGEDGVIVPAFDAQRLEEFQRVEIGVFQVAIQHWLARPAGSGQAAIGVQQWSQG